MAGQLTIDTLKASSGVLASQNGMTGIAKAWVNFTTSGSSCVITSSFNVSSVTYRSVGGYTVNFTTTLNQTPSIVTTGVNNVSTPNYFDFIVCSSPSTTSAPIELRRWQSGSFSVIDSVTALGVAAFA